MERYKVITFMGMSGLRDFLKNNDIEIAQIFPDTDTNPTVTIVYREIKPDGPNHEIHKPTYEIQNEVEGHYDKLREQVIVTPNPKTGSVIHENCQTFNDQELQLLSQALGTEIDELSKYEDGPPLMVMSLLNKIKGLRYEATNPNTQDMTKSNYLDGNKRATVFNMIITSLRKVLNQYPDIDLAETICKLRKIRDEEPILNKEDLDWIINILQWQPLQNQKGKAIVEKLKELKKNY